MQRLCQQHSQEGQGLNLASLKVDPSPSPSAMYVVFALLFIDVALSIATHTPTRAWHSGESPGAQRKSQKCHATVQSAQSVWKKVKKKNPLEGCTKALTFLEHPMQFWLYLYIIRKLSLGNTVSMAMQVFTYVEVFVLIDDLGIFHGSGRRTLLETIGLKGWQSYVNISCTKPEMKTKKCRIPVRVNCWSENELWIMKTPKI